MISFEQILEWKGYPLKKAGAQLEHFSLLENTEKHLWIEKKKEEIIQYHFNHNPLYKKLLKGPLPSHWNDLPVVTKSDLQAPIKEMLSTTFATRDIYVSNTSGSSGHPFFFAKDKFTHALTWAFIARSYKQLGILPGSVQARFYGIPLDRISYAKEKVKDYFMNRIRFAVFDMGDEMLEKFLFKFRKRKIDYVYGYTNSIVLFAKFLNKKELVLKGECPALHLCIVTSEVCTEEDKKLIEKSFGVPVVREYGASELDVIAIEDLGGRWGINEANVWVEVLAENNQPVRQGEEGRLVVTSLHNKAMPFIRYDIGDVGIVDTDQKGLVLKKLSGRVNDTIILPSGRKSPGLTFYYVSRSILESSGVLKEFIIRQTAINRFEFDVVSDRDLTDAEINDMKDKMDLYLEPGLHLTVRRVNKIQRPASGKIKHFYSELQS